jgi:hypothetical protein
MMTESQVPSSIVTLPFSLPSMRSNRISRVWLPVAATLLSGALVFADEESDRIEFFEKHIRPALIEHCLACHSNAAEINGGLLLDSATGWGKGGDSGRAIEPGNPKASLLVKAIEYDDPNLQMPPDGKMPVKVIEDFRKWIREGAIDPRESVEPSKSATALPLERAQEHWSYRLITGLLTDLKQRGLPEDTIAWWGGEFGRTPYAQANGTGRDHNPGGFTVWLTGAGLKSGFAFGETDEFGHHAVVNKVHMHDLHRTLLHLMGLDHERWTYRYAGRNFRLTDVHGRVVHDVMA